MPMLDALATYLEQQGIGTVKTSSNDPSSWPIFKGGAATTKADIIYLTEGPGSAPLDTMSGVVAENPSLVVQARHADYATAKAKAEAIWEKLHRLGNVTLSGVRYLLISARGQPFPTGRDEAGRWVIGCNYDVTKERG